MSNVAKHRIALTGNDWRGSLWHPRLTAEPGFERRGGSLHSYEYVGKHHPATDYDLPRSLLAGWWDRATPVV